MADTFDPAIYGYKEPEAKPANSGAPYTPPTPVSLDAAATSGAGLSYQQGQAALNSNRREDASTLASVGAAMTQWLPVHAYEYITAPDFVPVQDFSASSMLKQVPYTLDSTQEKFMLQARSPEEFQFRMDHMDQQRLAYQAMGDHSLAAFVTGAIDPGYLAIDMLSLGASRLARVAGVGAMGQRAAVAATAFAGTYAAGKMEQQVVPVSETEVFVNAMVNGAATGMLYNGHRMVPRDESFPGADLHQVAREVEAPRVAAAERSAVVAETAEVLAPTAPTPEVPLRTVSRRFEPGTGNEMSGKAMLATLESHPDPLISVLAKRVNELLPDDVRVLQVSQKDRAAIHSDGRVSDRAFYSPNDHTVYITKGTGPGSQLHEMTHALTAHKIEYGLANPTSAHGKIVAEMQTLLEQAKKAYSGGTWSGGAARKIEYYTKNLHEFTAGVFSGKSEFTDMLASIPVWPGAQRSVLGSVVDTIRRLLGMQPHDVNGLTHAIGLTESLAKERLNVTLHQGQFIATPGGKALPGSAMSIRLAPDELNAIHTDAQAKVALSKKLGENISWSLHKTMAGFGEKAREIADLLIDNPLSMSGDSVVSQHRAIRADLERVQHVYEDQLSKAMADRGFGLMQRIVKPRQALKAQQALERDVGMEMLRRNRLSADGMPIDKAGIPEHVTKMADALDAVSDAALAELKRSGVTGAEEIGQRSGYFSRRWDFSKIDGMESKLVVGGATAAEARSTVRDAIIIGVQRANGWDSELARDVGGAIYDRARSKGYFEDSALRRHQGQDTLSEVRNVLASSGIPEARMQRVLDILAGKVDEKGKMPSLKSRVDVAMDESITFPDGSTGTIADMIDMNMVSTTERYLDNVAAQASFARKGLPSASDVVALRKELLGSIASETERGKAAKLFDNTISYLRGDPVGEEIPSFMRKAQAVTQMVGLARAGIFQFTEYATAMAHYGAGATMASVFKELPFFKSMFSTPQEATHLRNILSGNSSQDMRIRPFVNRMEDNFEIPVSDSVQLSLMQAKQMVPYLNALKFVQGHQARTVANLVVDTFQRGAQGDVKAIEALGKYGLEPRIMDGIRSEIISAGMDTTQWSKATWDAVRGPLTKMMDDSVLRNRTGEIPAFAQFTSTGKFLFTFRSFVLGAHNKVLAGTLSRNGFNGLGLLMLYQFPMTYAVVAADAATTKGKAQTDKQLMGQAFGQMGSMGLFSEAVGVALGTKQQFGSPGTIAIDRVYKLGSALSSGNTGQAGAATLNSVPLLSVILPVKAIGEHLKDTKKE